MTSQRTCDSTPRKFSEFAKSVSLSLVRAPPQKRGRQKNRGRSQKAGRLDQVAHGLNNQYFVLIPLGEFQKGSARQSMPPHNGGLRLSPQVLQQPQVIGAEKKGAAEGDYHFDEVVRHEINEFQQCHSW